MTVRSTGPTPGPLSGTSPGSATAPPRVLAIAGSDSGGGAGLQADLKTFCAHRVYGMTVVTAVTAQNTRTVTAVHAVPAVVVAAQIEAVLSDIGADAIKIGMLANEEIVRVVGSALRAYLRSGETACPVVLDPVMVAKSGAALLHEDAVAALREELVPLATVITPNLPEAEILGGRSAPSHEARLELARELGERGPAVLLKGAHAEGDAIVDILVHGEEEEAWTHPRIQTTSTHGTGCTLSSALAARLARGDSVRNAVHGGIAYLQGAIKAAFPLGLSGEGNGPVDHLFELGGRSGGDDG